MTPAQLERLCGDWRERETFLCGPAGLLEAMRERWRRDGDPGAPARRALPADERVSDGERGRAADQLRASDVRPSSDGEQPILAGRRAGRRAASLRLSHGHLPQCVGRLRSGQVRDLRTGRVHGQPGRAAAHLHQRARGRDRDRPLTHPQESPMSSTQTVAPRKPLNEPRAAAGAPAGGTAEPARAPDAGADRAARPRVRRDPRRGLRRPRRARLALHPQHDQAAPPARARAPARCCSARVTGRCGCAGTASLSLAKILENMEIGHNVMHGQWDWMNDPGHQLPDLGLGHRLAAPTRGGTRTTTSTTRSPTSAARTATSATRSCASTRTSVAPGLPAPAALQPAADGLLRVGRGAARPQPRRDPRGREVQGSR